jgi:hypothetical protein
MIAESQRKLTIVLWVFVAGCLESNLQSSPEGSQAAEDVVASAPQKLHRPRHGVGPTV